MDITGGDGPKLEKVFTCKDCKWLGDIHGEYQKHSCLHTEVIAQYKNDSEFMYNIFTGTINKDLITPSFCPYLIKKLRYEKIKEINGT